MIRDRLKRAVKAIGQRLFLPEERQSVRERVRGEIDPDANLDDLMPALVDGDGDTPGPNHKTDIGRTWAAAQLLGGAGIVAIDIRSPSEWAVGHLPGARLIPAALVAENLDVLPAPDDVTWFAIYDATGAQESGDIAELLRQRGWARARRLVGGFAEWVEEGEEVQTPPETSPWQVGDSVRTKSGDAGILWRAPEGADRNWRVLIPDGLSPRTVKCAPGDLSR